MSDNNTVIVGAIAAGTGLLAFAGGRWDARRSARREQRDELRQRMEDAEREVLKVRTERDIAIERLTVSERALNDTRQMLELLTAAKQQGGKP